MSYLYRLFLVVLTILASILVSSMAVLCRLACSDSDRYSVSLSRLSQYTVSLASLRAIFILLRKSAFD